ncbi:protein of unknown function [Carnobacterium iners]|uniref:Transcobalamin-like C-terminal domain-containing protein n=1 Tax=Carnobacterium iners TaxID=1073423 RepID=A0A1X7MX24_9LACT|nr:DUF4430 domain-containing protein [Carnobacterium iners]SEK17926.1 protein of unknown function [Carnobacterium iners]SMH29309.1 protein of unknown function [Carnobacterium iners]
MYKLKPLLILGLTLILTACGAPANNESASSQVVPEQASSISIPETVEATIVFEVDEEEQADMARSLKVEEGTTLLDAMNVEYEVKETDGFITAIDGIEQDDSKNKWWLYSVNGEDGTVGAADYEIKEDDQIKWTLNGN